MRPFRISVDIAVPPERVWSVMSDLVGWHEWTPSVTSIRRLDDGAMRVGSRRMTRGITERYLAFEATGLKARSEDPHFWHRGGVPPSPAWRQSVHG